MKDYLATEINNVSHVEVRSLLINGDGFDFNQMVKYQNLEKLTIKNTSSKRLNEKLIFSLPKLRDLIISNNNKLEAFHLPTDVNSNLEKFSLTKGNIKRIPNNLGQLMNLKRLDLEQNNIAEINLEILDLNLEYLNLSYNQITYFPSQISKIKSLKHLLVNSNKINEISLSYSSYSNLETLSLFGNRIEYFEFLSDNNGLKKLHLGLNKLKAIPESLKHLNLLKTLSLSHNKGIKNIPNWFGEKLKNLEELSLSGLEEVDFLDEFLGMDKLLELNLSDNRLEQFPKFIYHLRNLEILDLKLNLINEIPAEIKHFQNLKALIIKYNQLEKIPRELFQLKKLEMLDISSNLISMSEIQNISKELKNNIEFIH